MGTNYTNQNKKVHISTWGIAERILYMREGTQARVGRLHEVFSPSPNRPKYRWRETYCMASKLSRSESPGLLSAATPKRSRAFHCCWQRRGNLPSHCGYLSTYPQYLPVPWNRCSGPRWDLSRLPSIESHQWYFKHLLQMYKTKQTSWALVSKRTIPTDRPPLVDETFVDRGVSRGQRGGSPTVVYLSFLDRSRYFSFK
jgi:hypothetical protein